MREREKSKVSIKRYQAHATNSKDFARENSCTHFITYVS